MITTSHLCWTVTHRFEDDEHYAVRDERILIIPKKSRKQSRKCLHKAHLVMPAAIRMNFKPNPNSNSNAVCV